MVTFTEAFAHFGIKLKNPQGHWSGRNGNTVVVTMWADFLRNRESTVPPQACHQSQLKFQNGDVSATT
jgi:hypothetical protein